MDIAQISIVSNDCYRRIKFRSAASGRHFQVELYLSPDRRFLSRELLDTKVDPIEEEQRKQREFLAGLTAGGFASTGPKNASVILTVFSDFQCPYCARLATILRNDVLPFERDNVRLVFRHFPLSNHAWARITAETTACAQQQNDKFFWALHDFVFDKQQELNQENAKEKIIGYSNRFWGFDRVKFETCLAQRKAAPMIERDLAFGNEHGVSGTPTMFINGQMVANSSDPVQIRSLIRQFSEANPKSAAILQVPSAQSPSRR